jgi:hypothetical protein
MSRDLLATVAVALAATATLLAAPRPARACGPDFPEALLHDRADTLGTLPEGVFMTEVAHLVTPRHRYEYVGDAPVPDDAGSRERALYEAGEWAAVLALPPAQRRHRSVRAAYMLGRESDDPAAYRRVRALVDAGFEDGAGLALASLGQEARLRLQLHHDPVGAIRLYAEQAALGHPSAGPSLLFVIRELVERGGERPLLRDDVGQRLLATYLATRGLELDEAQADRLWRELASIDRVAGAEQLAAFAYQRGEWARAAAFAARAGDAPMAQWVQAKLALRGGDTATADRLLAAAAEGFRVRNACADDDQPTVAWTDLVPAAREDLALEAAAAAPGPEPDITYASYDVHEERLLCRREHDRLVGERAVIAVGDGRMTDALALTWQLRELHPDDLNYVAERLVTIPELIAFVDALPPAAPGADEPSWWGVDEASLRALLGRRLMRAGRHLEAIAYLPPAQREAALAYGVAMARAAATGDRFERARALYLASRIARRDGLEILGTAGAPDWQFYEAQYDRFAWDDRGLIAGRGPRELARVLASAPARGQRYHYRYLASDLAEQAADLVPHRSQAYGASLCWAARHVRNVDEPRVQTLYWRAMDGGRYLEDISFPDGCPEPDFDAARAVPLTRAAPPPAVVPARAGFFPPGYGRRWLHRLALLAGGFAVVGLLGLFAAASRRRWRAFAPRP